MGFLIVLALKLLCRTRRTRIKGWLQQGCIAKSNAALWSPIFVYPNVWDELERQWINRLELKARQLFFSFFSFFPYFALLFVPESRKWELRFSLCRNAGTWLKWTFVFGLPAWTFEWCRYLWLYTHMLISMCYLGAAELQSSGMDSLAALGFLVSGICFDKSWEWREQGRSEALCTNTSQWEQVSHQNYKKPTWAFWWRNRTKNDCEGIKENLCIFQLQSDTSLLSYPVTTHSILTEK